MARGIRYLTRRTKWGLATFVLFCCAVLLLNVFGVRRARIEHAIVDTAVKASAAAQEQRESARQADLKRARATLPTDAGIPPAWTAEDVAHPYEKERNLEALMLRLQVARLLLSSGDMKAEAGAVARAVEDTIARIGARSADGEGLDEIYSQLRANLDVASRGPEAVLSGIDERLASLLVVRRLETGYEHGVFPVRKAALDCCPPRLMALSELVRALEYRAVFEARRGEVDRAIHSYSNAQGMRRLLTESKADLMESDLWSLERIVDFAWRVRPLTQEQRDRLVPSAPPCASPERLAIYVYAELEDRRREMLRRLQQTRESARFGTIQVWLERYAQQKDRKRLNSWALQLVPLFSQPPYVALPTMSKLLDGSLESSSARRTTELLADVYITGARVRFAHEVALIAFALKDYKQVHGEYPATLEALPSCSPPLPSVDPLTGQPVGYESDGKTFAISSCSTALPPDAPAFIKETIRWMNANLVVWKASE